MNHMAEPNSWSTFERMEARKTEDEHLVQEWARTNADGHALEQHVRNFVRHVRQDIGVHGVITEVVEVKRSRKGIKVALAYHMEPDPLDELPGLSPSTASSPGRPLGNQRGSLSETVSTTPASSSAEGHGAV